MSSNYSSNMDFQREAHAVGSVKNLHESAKVFGSFWWFFGALSVWATYYTLSIVFEDWSVDPIILTVVIFGLALIWDIFKYYSIEWMFADQDPRTRMTAKVVFIALVLGSMLFHLYGATLRSSSGATDSVKKEVQYQRDLENKKLDLSSKLIDSNKDLAPVLLNGSSADDSGTVGTMNLTLRLVEDLQKKESSNISSEELLSIYAKDVSVKSDGVMYAQIIAETFLMFTLLSKFIYIANRDESMKEFMEAKEALFELLAVSKNNMTADFIQTALDELNGYQLAKNKTGLGFIQQKIDNAREVLRPSKELPYEGEQHKQLDQKAIPYKDVSDNLFDDCQDAEIEEEIKQAVKEREIEVEASNIKVKALDLTVLPDGFSQVARAMFDGGEVEVGEQLIPQSLVMKRLRSQGVPKVQSIVDLTYEHLRNYGYIAKEGTNGSHIAKAQLPKQIWTEAA